MIRGEVIGDRYRLDSMLGRGGMGEVWAAEQLPDGHPVAIKFLTGRSGVTAETRKRFVREGKTSLRIRHSAIVDFLDTGEHADGTLYVVMERLRGEALGEALDGFPTMAMVDFLSVMTDVARGLAAAHSKGIIHRDIKPQNIFIVREKGQPARGKILDFGTSKVLLTADSIATHVTALLGTPRYMSPEQMHSSANIDARADIWSFGVVLFEGLTGQWPHEGETLLEVAVAVTTTRPRSIDAVLPTLPEALRRLVTDCLKPLDARIKDAGELVRRLEAVLVEAPLEDMRLPYAGEEDGPTRAVKRMLIPAEDPDSEDDELPSVGDGENADGATALMNDGLVRALRERSRGLAIKNRALADSDAATDPTADDPQRHVPTVRPPPPAPVSDRAPDDEIVTAEIPALELPPEEGWEQPLQVDEEARSDLDGQKERGEGHTEVLALPATRRRVSIRPVQPPRRHDAPSDRASPRTVKSSRTLAIVVLLLWMATIVALAWHWPDLGASGSEPAIPSR